MTKLLCPLSSNIQAVIPGYTWKEPHKLGPFHSTRDKGLLGAVPPDPTWITILTLCRILASKLNVESILSGSPTGQHSTLGLFRILDDTLLLK